LKELKKLYDNNWTLNKYFMMKLITILMNSINSVRGFTKLIKFKKHNENYLIIILSKFWVLKYLIKL